METTPNLQLVIPSSDQDPFDELVLRDAFRSLDAQLGGKAARVFSNVNVTQGHNGNGTGAHVPLPFNAERFDPGGWHDVAVDNSRIVIPTPMVVAAAVRISWAAAGGAAGIRSVRVTHRLAATNAVVNGIDLDQPGSTAIFSQIAVGLFSVAAGDRITGDVYQSSGGNLDVLANAELMVWKVLG
jgi:hypothetical protein